jgi:hypothetical protein
MQNRRAKTYLNTNNGWLLWSDRHRPHPQWVEISDTVAAVIERGRLSF